MLSLKHNSQYDKINLENKEEWYIDNNILLLLLIVINITI